MKSSQNDSGNVSRNEQMQQRAHQSRLRYDVSARLDANIIATLRLSRRRVPTAKDRRNERANTTGANARDCMIDSALKALALTALASIAIGTVRWLMRRPTALLVVLMLIGASTLLMR
jgi:hypothetical protein